VVMYHNVKNKVPFGPVFIFELELELEFLGQIPNWELV
jgi:hypothetical protein